MKKPKRPTILALSLLSLIILTGAVAQFAIMSTDRITSRDISLIYTLTLNSPPAETGELTVLLPLANASSAQEILDYSIESASPYTEIQENEYGNRALLFTGNDSDGATTTTINVAIRARRLAQSTDGSAMAHTAPTAESLSRFLQPDRLVPLDGPILAEAQRVIPDGSDDRARMRALYDHLCETMRYDKTGEGWGNGDALFACDIREGNCTDIHSLFIALARTSGVPARFVMGFPLPASNKEQNVEIAGYHCWAEFYLPDEGWIPVDISEAIKHPEKREFYFGNLDPNRITFSVGRDIVFPELHSDVDHQPLNYFIYPLVSVNGGPFSTAPRSEWRLSLLPEASL